MIKKMLIAGVITIAAFTVAKAQDSDKGKDETVEYKNERRRMPEPPRPHRRNSDDYEAKKRELREMQQQLDQEKRDANRKLAMDYGTNFLRLSPIKVLDIGAIGFGIEYEKLFGENKMFGVNLPLTLMLDQEIFDDPVYGYSNDNVEYHPYFYFTPGLKIYPMGQRKVTYAVGPTLMIGYGKSNEWTWVSTQTGGYSQSGDRNNWRLGLMVMNYVNFQFVKNFSMGIDAGIGIRYMNHYNNPNYNDEIQPTGQFSLTFGYRF